jgi:hypothetical protein
MLYLAQEDCKTRGTAPDSVSDVTPRTPPPLGIRPLMLHHLLSIYMSSLLGGIANNSDESPIFMDV